MISEFTNPTEEETPESAVKPSFFDLRLRYEGKTCLVEVGTGTDRKLGTTNTIQVKCYVNSVVSRFGRTRAYIRPWYGSGVMIVDISKLGEPE